MTNSIASSIWTARYSRAEAQRRGEGSPTFQGRARLAVFAALAILALEWPARVGAQPVDLSAIGMNLLIMQDATLTGQGARMAQPEAGYPTFEVNTNIQPAAIFNYTSSNGTASVFPNSEGTESSHADQVGSILYGPQGVAPGISPVDNYQADYFENLIVARGTSIPALIVNQSFVNLYTDAQMQAQGDAVFDTYAAQNNVLFISGAGNGGTVDSPGSCFNGLGVGAYGGASSTGPTPDGRCKPDITAPEGATSFSTPQVSGAAAILWQAGQRGDGGAGTASVATEPMTIKALLLNGAVKTVDWTNSTANPLDFRYGAGLLNVYNSWKQLAAGRLVSGQQSGTALVGWDNASIQVENSGDQTIHYYFQVPPSGGNPVAAVATLIWEKHANASSINRLNLLLHRTADGSLAASSQSTVDNMQHLYVTSLAPGGYDLQVVSQPSGGVLPFGASETYALAVSFTTSPLSVQAASSGVQIVWPVYPAGQVLQSVSALGAGMNWTTVTNQASVMNGQNVISMGASGSAMFFELAPP